jgi:hypothetical protein
MGVRPLGLTPILLLMRRRKLSTAAMPPCGNGTAACMFSRHISASGSTVERHRHAHRQRSHHRQWLRLHLPCHDVGKCLCHEPAVRPAISVSDGWGSPPVGCGICNRAVHVISENRSRNHLAPAARPPETACRSPAGSTYQAPSMRTAAPPARPRRRASRSAAPSR